MKKKCGRSVDGKRERIKDEQTQWRVTNTAVKLQHAAFYRMLEALKIPVRNPNNQYLLFKLNENVQ